MAIAAMAFASCEPEILSGGVPGDNVTAEQVQNWFVIDGQFADAACTQPASDGNFIKFHTSPAVTVSISNTAPDGTKNILYTGASGVFNITPKRGNPNEQPFLVEAINPDASIVSFSSKVNVFVPSELAPELQLLLGDGRKTWMWDCVNATCWGNAGNSGAGSAFTAKTVDGKWWGVETAEALLDQLDHSGGVETGAENSGAYMVFDEDGNIGSFKADGSPIVSGTYKVADYDADRASGWELGKLQTSVPAVLFPYSINEGGKAVSEFDLMYLDRNYMTLVYTKGNGAGSWGEITYWCFKNKDVIEDILNGGSERAWTWDYREAVPDGGGTDPLPCQQFWGNAGSTGAGAEFTADAISGMWWGVKSTEEFEGQNAHSGGAVVPDMNKDAYMVFTADGKITSYGADGTQIATANYEVTDWDATRGEAGWQLGYLETSAPSVLFPYSINLGGKTVNKFSIMYADADYLTLVDDKDTVGGWGEITFWKFKAK